MSHSITIQSKTHKSIIISFLRWFKSQKTTVIPLWLIEKRDSKVSKESKAATTIIKLAKNANLTPSRLSEIYQIELEYEIKKYELLQQIPHLHIIMKEEIDQLRSIKMGKMQKILTQNQLGIYSKIYLQNKKHN
jgi:hypothetical protein